eukprot:5754658-Prymnesium_polylepis.1
MGLSSAAARLPELDALAALLGLERPVAPEVCRLDTARREPPLDGLTAEDEPIERWRLCGPGGGAPPRASLGDGCEGVRAEG